MQARLLRRQYRGFWRVMSRLVPALVVVELLLLVLAQRAEAATDVAFVQAEMRASYQAQRVYAGRTVPGRASDLGFKAPGELAAVGVDVGDPVTAGQELARLDVRALQAALAQAAADVAHAEASLAAMAARAELARQTEARFAGLQSSGHVSKQEYDERRLELEARRAEVEVARATVARAGAARTAADIALVEARILAPFNGVIQARYVDEGRQLQGAEPVLRLVESERVEAHVGVPESLATALRRDDRYTLRWGDQRLDAVLSAVLPEVDPATRTLTAVFRLARADVPLGVVVELEAEREVAAAGFWLPLTALTESDRGLWGVFVIGADGTLDRRIVEVLHAEAERAFVRGTLEPGDRVVSTGVQRLVPGQRVSSSGAAG
jgi:RND family efflux transporter MFP subunit